MNLWSSWELINAGHWTTFTVLFPQEFRLFIYRRPINAVQPACKGSCHREACNMKLTLLLILCWCLCTLGRLQKLYVSSILYQTLSTVYADGIVTVTKPPFVRSRYSLRWLKTTSTTPPGTTERAAATEIVTSTEHPKAATSTVSSDYDYYGNGEADNIVHK